MYDLGALFWMYAVVVVQHQSSRTLAAWDTGLEAVALYHPQWYSHVKAGYRAWGTALVKHKAPLHRTAHSCGRQQQTTKQRQRLRTL